MRCSFYDIDLHRSGDVEMRVGSDESGEIVWDILEGNAIGEDLVSKRQKLSTDLVVDVTELKVGAVANRVVVVFAIELLDSRSFAICVDLVA